MSLEIRTFAIRDAAAEEDETRLSAFLHTVEVERIDTSYSDGAWRILVQYRDRRRKEERAQIETAIQAALNLWRGEVARNHGLEREAVLPTALLSEIARYAPTTEVELAVIGNAVGISTQERGGDIVRVVRQTMEELTSDEV